MKSKKRPLSVFLCHASQDKPKARALRDKLISDGIDVWLDEEKLIPGQNWEIQILKAVKSSDVVIICLSKKSINKEGFFQKEISFALGAAEEKPEETIYIIPTKLENLQAPSRVSKWQWVNLFENDGYERLLISLDSRASTLGLAPRKKIYRQNYKFIGAIIAITLFIAAIVFGISSNYLSAFRNNALPKALQLSNTPNPTQPVTTTPAAGSEISNDTAIPVSLDNPIVIIFPSQEAADSNSCPRRVIFHSFRDNNMDLYSLSGIEGFPGSELINLTNDPSTDARPSLSPDYKTIAFQSTRDGNTEIYLVNENGESLQRLTKSQSNNINPIFSPDGNHIAFQSDRNGRSDLFMIDLLSGQETQITSSPRDDINPYWSPDPKWMVFQSNRDNAWNIYLLNTENGSEFKLTNFSNADAINPSWSPNGDSIAFIFADRHDNNKYLFISNLTGGTTQITKSGSVSNYSWSPDGTKIAYQLNINESSNIYIYDFQTKATLQITEGPHLNISPSWSCDGKEIYFASDRNGNLNIFRVDSTGGIQSNLTLNGATDKWPLGGPYKEFGSLGQ